MTNEKNHHQIETAYQCPYHYAMTTSPATTADNLNSPGRPIAISNWLLGVASLVIIMVIVGGITRLTESGLSITEWKPITGAIPPLNADD